MKRSEARGTWLESHFRWQIRTFWFGLLWVALCILFVVLTLGIGILIAWLPLGIVSIWFIYRIVRGWLALANAARCTSSSEAGSTLPIPPPEDRSARAKPALERGTLLRDWTARGSLSLPGRGLG